MYSKDNLIAALELRYDAYSAGAVLEIARDRAELADKPTYDANELRVLRAAIATVGDRVGRVLDAIDELLASAPPVAAKPESKVEAEPEPKVEAKPEPKVEAKPEPKIEAKPEPKLEAKPEPKVEAKPEPKVEAKPEPKVEAAVETTVVLAGFETDDDDEVLLCGASDLLGDWDPARARPMARNGDQWLAQITVPAGTELAFKFIRRSPGGDVSWEAGDDRTLVAKPRIEVTAR